MVEGTGSGQREVISVGSCYNQRSLPTPIAMALINYITQIQFEFGAIGLPGSSANGSASAVR